MALNSEEFDYSAFCWFQREFGGKMLSEEEVGAEIEKLNNLGDKKIKEISEYLYKCCDEYWEEQMESIYRDPSWHDGVNELQREYRKNFYVTHPEEVGKWENDEDEDGECPAVISRGSLLDYFETNKNEYELYKDFLFDAVWECMQEEKVTDDAWINASFEAGSNYDVLAGIIYGFIVTYALADWG